MKIPVVSLLLPLGVESFQIMPARPVVRLLNKAVEGETHITVNPMEGYKGVDLARAKECAEHFGECSVEEMEDLRKSELVSGWTCFYSVMFAMLSFNSPC